MNVERVGPYLWRIPQDVGAGMRVPGLVVADEVLMAPIRSEAALAQLANGATLPGIVKAALAMPDIHQGYGLPVGGVVATDVAHGVVSPGAIGFDINCGVRLLATDLAVDDVRDRIGALVEALYAAIPTGVGSRGAVTLEDRELAAVMEQGAAWAVARGHGLPDDPERLESDGRVPRADANFAFANRQMLTHRTREVFARTLGVPPQSLRVVYDVAHNIAKEEEHEVDGQRRRLLVHRKGATRAFPGQPVLVPGDMGRYSFLLVGTDAAMRETFGSTCHGAGRVLSRTAAVKAARGRRIADELAARGITVRATGRDALAEEMPEAYKDVRDVVDVVHNFGISTKVARLRPIGVIKG